MSQDTLVSILADLREEEALQIVQNQLTAGENPLTILDSCRKAVEIVGERFEKSEYFLPDLIMAGEILKEIAELVKPKMGAVGEVKRVGKVVIGTGTGGYP